MLCRGVEYGEVEGGATDDVKVRDQAEVTHMEGFEYVLVREITSDWPWRRPKVWCSSKGRQEGQGEKEVVVLQTESKEASSHNLILPWRFSGRMARPRQITNQGVKQTGGPCHVRRGWAVLDQTSTRTVVLVVIRESDVAPSSGGTFDANCEKPVGKFRLVPQEQPELYGVPWGSQSINPPHDPFVQC
jgi:hypothetical protein